MARAKPDPYQQRKRKLSTVLTKDKFSNSLNIHQQTHHSKNNTVHWQ